MPITAVSAPLKYGSGTWSITEFKSASPRSWVQHSTHARRVPRVIRLLCEVAELLRRTEEASIKRIVAVLAGNGVLKGSAMSNLMHVS